ncbi:MAG: hypothetical protein KBC06_00075 [Candidatus Pacebacteria bacterium]|nr:hypothetical protein [Candidatus Paceibacterota bacterium]
MKKSILVGGTIISLLVLIFLVYFFVRGNKPDDLNSTRNKLQSDLAIAQSKLANEKNKLDSMLDSLKQSFSLAVSVQDQMRQATDVVNRTNFMFHDPNGASPELIVKNPLQNIPINDQRKNINSLLTDWRTKLSLSSLKLIDVAESERIKKNTETIQQYLESLHQIADKLTPENSDLSQYQIDIYKQNLPAVEEVKQIISNIDAAIQNAQNGNSQSSGSTGNSGNSTSSGSQNPPVTPEDVIDQQNTVDDGQDQVDTIQNQIDQIDQQTETPPPTVPPVETPPETPVAETENNTVNYGVRRTIDKNQGIIVQPGPAQLIPGTDPY